MKCVSDAPLFSLGGHEMLRRWSFIVLAVCMYASSAMAVLFIMSE